MSHATFIGTRARLQRLSDAQFFWGWVKDFGPEELKLTCGGDYEIASGEQFLVQLAGKGVNALIKAQVGTPHGRELRFRIIGPIKVVASKEDVRFLLAGVEGSVNHEDQDIGVQITDVSEHGAGVLSETQFERGARLEFCFETPGGAISGRAQVRYSRPDPDETGKFRTGLQILAFSRIDQARWIKLLEERPWASCEPVQPSQKAS